MKKGWETKYLRIMDANFNRAKEALRVCEDFARFLLCDEKLTAKFKRCRHRLTEILTRFPASYARLVASRDSVHDVGRDDWIQDGRRKPGWRKVMTANLKRGQEALRVLEELAKMIAPRRARALGRLRFELYELEKRSFRKF